ncbi:hypothetical protein [Cohnella sp. 56]|uniref:hypothetical protein n=1 Tax=Cohnella sp. 56 TaxID=3113722 RepID=UPI0030EB0A60
MQDVKEKDGRQRTVTAFPAASRLLAALWLAVLLFTLGMLAAGWPRYWIYIAAETTPQGWLESVLLVLAAAMAGLNAFAAAAEASGPMRGRGGDGGPDRGAAGAGAGGPERRAAGAGRTRGAGALSGLLRRRQGWAWTIVAAAFAWLALDERFAVHERLRDRYLKQTGVKLLPWMEAGDWIIPIYAVCGLAAVWGLWQLLGASRAARAFMAAGLLLAFCAVSLDTLDIRSMSRASERLFQTIEECLETGAMTAFVSSFLSVLTGRLAAWYNIASIRR